MAHNPFFKNTKGFNAEAIVATASAAGGVTNIETMVSTAAEGSIAVFDAETNVRITTAAAAGTKLYFAQKRNGLINKTTPITLYTGVAALYEYIAPAADVWTVNLAAGTVVQGDTLELVLIETTPLAQPFPTYNFAINVRSGETQAQALARLLVQFNDPLSGQWYYWGKIASAALTGGDIVITSSDVNRTFKVVVREKLNDLLDTTGIVHTTVGTPGFGTYLAVKQLEDEALIFQGVTTNYPAPINALPEEFGKPTEFSATGTNYDLIVLSPWMSEYSPTPVDRHFHKKYQVIAAATGGAVITALSTILGLGE